MLSLMRFRRRVAEIAACGMPSDFSSAGRKPVAEFYMFCFSEGIASGKHVAQTVDQSAKTACEKVDLKEV